MRAAIVERLGEPPAIGERPDPTPGEGQVAIDVTAAAVNPVDLSIASGKFWTGAPELPYVPGKEGVGEVVVGESPAPGTRVWFETPGGYGGDGAFAQRSCVDAQDTVELPDGLDDALAACLGVAGLAAWLALDWRAQLRAGETVLVLGATGAVGQIAVQAARILGAGRVVAAGRDTEALERTRALGADAIVALGDDIDLAGAFTEAAGGPIDVTVDPLWGPPAVAATEASGQGARLVQLGQSAGTEATLASSVVRGKSLAILGHFNAGAPLEVRHAAYRCIADEAAAGALTVEHERIPLEEVGTAWERQASSPHLKLVLTP